MKNKCVHTIKNEPERCSFIILCSQKSNKRGYKNIPLTPIDTQDNLIDRQIKTIQSLYKNSEIIIVSGFEHDQLLSHIRHKKYSNIRIAENKDYKNSDSLDCWTFALNLCLTQNTFIIHGDRIFSPSCIENERKRTHTLYHNSTKNNYDLGILFKDNRLLNISYGLPNVWSEIFFISRSDFDIARDLINEQKQRKFYNLDGFINALNKQIPIDVIGKTSSDIQTLREI